MTAKEQFELWLSKAEGAILDELQTVSTDAEIERRFGTVQKFGTAGIRCEMGAGSSLLNDYTVRRVARGLAQYMLSGGVKKSCAIGYDSRHNSRRFAEIAAQALAAEGVKVYLYDRLCPTPMLSFAVRHLHCGAGIVVSASHNTKEYNGIKCYGDDGCQMTEVPAAAVSANIDALDYFTPDKAAFSDLLASGKIEYIGADVWQAYYDTVSAQLVAPEKIAKADLSVVYSPLCGAGGEPVNFMLKKYGAKVSVPESQAKPSGDFATCPSPNPENDAAFAEAFKLADQVKPDIVLATDPDSDRIACAVWDGAQYTKLTGNEMGCLLLDYIFRSGKTPKQPVTVQSIVSSPMAAKIAASYGADVRITPTGFKYIGATILELEAQKRPNDFVFGFEESCGYLKGTYCRDKDAVLAAALISEMAADYKMQGKTLLQAIAELYDKFGYTTAALQNIVFTTPEIRAKCAAKLEQIKHDPPSDVAGIKVLTATDFSVGEVLDLATGKRTAIDFPKENMLRLELDGGARVILRPSGTEPKMKLYYTAASDVSLADARALASRLQDGMTAWLDA